MNCFLRSSFNYIFGRFFSQSFLYCFIMLLHLIFSFLRNRFLLFSYAYISTESIDYNHLSSFELKTVLLISSVKTWCLLLLNLCCVFNITSLVLKKYLDFFRKIFTLVLFSLDSLFYFQVEILVNRFYNLQI